MLQFKFPVPTEIFPNSDHGKIARKPAEMLAAGRLMEPQIRDFPDRFP